MISLESGNQPKVNRLLFVTLIARVEQATCIYYMFCFCLCPCCGQNCKDPQSFASQENGSEERAPRVAPGQAWIGIG